MKRVTAVVAALVVTALSAPASAHGDLQETSPRDGATVRRTPKEIRISLTEAPTRGAEARAIDGCRKRAPGTVSVDGNDIVVTIDGGEPGNWRVSYRAVSSVDGHQTRGKFGFRVSGRKECTPDKPADEPTDDIAADDQPGIIENPNPPDESSTAWLLWVALGTVLIAGVAFFLRRSSQ